MRKSKKIIAALAGVMILTGAVSFGAHAYFTSQDTAKTAFKIVKIDTEIEEEIDPNTNQKKVSIQNVSTSDCYVRVRITTSPEQVMEALKLEGLNEEDWFVVNKDGINYYYYKYVLKSKETSQPLFTGYSLDKEIFKSLNITPGNVDISVYEESVQVLYEIDPSDPTKAILDSFATYDQYSN